MPRFARVKYPGGIFHVIARCLNRDFLIEDDRDREKYLGLLGKTLGRTDASVLAYCLMSNHVHIVVRAGEDPLERLFKPVHTGYALWKNGRHGRLGPVFAGRFKSPLVDEEAYLLELVRYVHNNPVRAGIVPQAAASGWSSHRAYIGAEKAPPWLRMGEVLGMFATEGRRGDFAGDAIEGVSRAIATEVGDAWRLSHPIVGNEVFATKVLADLKKADQAGQQRFSDARGRRGGTS